MPELLNSQTEKDLKETSGGESQAPGRPCSVCGAAVKAFKKID